MGTFLTIKFAELKYAKENNLAELERVVRGCISRFINVQTQLL